MSQKARANTGKKRLDLDTIVAAALALLDEKGIDGVTTRAIAARLGIQSPSLYWHIKNKKTLLSHMAEAMFMENIPDPDIRNEDWQTWLIAGAHCIRNAALSRRDGAKVIAASQPTGSIDRLSFPAMIKRLEDEGFSRPQALNAFLVMGRFTLGWALAEQLDGGPPENRTEGVGYEFGLDIIVRGLEDMLATNTNKSETQT